MCSLTRKQHSLTSYCPPPHFQKSKRNITFHLYSSKLPTNQKILRTNSNHTSCQSCDLTTESKTSKSQLLQSNLFRLLPLPDTARDPNHQVSKWKINDSPNNYLKIGSAYLNNTHSSTDMNQLEFPFKPTACVLLTKY